MKLVTAVLLNYARPHNVAEIVRFLSGQPQVRQIIVWDNADTAANRFQPDGSAHVEVCRSNRNIFTLGRFVAAVRYARHELIWFQDDDIVNEHFADLYRLAVTETQNRMVVALPDDESSAHFTWYTVRQPPETDIGFGSFVQKSWIPPTFNLWLKHFPQTRHLVARKADKIFTILHGRRLLVRCPVKRLYNEDGTESGRDASALWLRPDHKKLDQEVVAKCQQILSRPKTFQ